MTGMYLYPRPEVNRLSQLPHTNGVWNAPPDKLLLGGGSQ